MFQLVGQLARPMARPAALQQWWRTIWPPLAIARQLTAGALSSPGQQRGNRRLGAARPGLDVRGPRRGRAVVLGPTSGDRPPAAGARLAAPSAAPNWPAELAADGPAVRSTGERAASTSSSAGWCRKAELAGLVLPHPNGLRQRLPVRQLLACAEGPSCCRPAANGNSAPPSGAWTSVIDDTRSRIWLAVTPRQPRRSRLRHGLAGRSARHEGRRSGVAAVSIAPPDLRLRVPVRRVQQDGARKSRIKVQPSAQ